MAPLDETEEDLLYLIQGIFSFFSVLGCLFMMIVVFTLKRPRKPKTTFTIGLGITEWGNEDSTKV